MQRVILAGVLLPALVGCGGAARVAVSAAGRSAARTAGTRLATTTVRSASATAVRPAASRLAVPAAGSTPMSSPLWKEVGLSLTEEGVKRGLEHLLQPATPAPATPTPASSPPQAFSPNRNLTYRPTYVWPGRFLGVDYPVVTAVHAGSVASRVGLRTGDILYRYDGVSLASETSKNPVMRTVREGNVRQRKGRVRLEVVRSGRVLGYTIPAGAGLGIGYRTLR